jgi:DNA repair exonuclease SbcCD ATPase subunit
MHIDKLYIKGFSSHKDTTIEFKTRVALFVGSLNAGKSSINQAIETALIGQCELYRKKTDVIADLVHDIGGMERFDLALETSLGSLRRGRGPEASYLKWNDQNGSSMEVEQALLRDLGATKTIISALLNNTDFFSIDGSVQRALVLSIIGAEVLKETIEAAFTGDREALEMIPFEVASLTAIDLAYKHAYDERRDVNRRLKELKPMDPPAGEQPPPVDAIKARVAALEKEEKDLIAEIAKHVGTKEATKQSRLDNLKSQREATQKKYDEYFNWFRTVEKPTKEEADRLGAELKKAQRAATTAASEKVIVEGKLADAKTTAKVQELNARLLRNFKGRCVAGDHVCPASAEDMRQAFVKADQAAKQALKDQEHLSALVIMATEDAANFTEVRAIEEKLGSLKRRSEEYKANVAAFNQTKDALRKLDEEIAEEETPRPEQEELKDLAAEDPITALEEKHKAVTDRIEKGRETLERAREWMYHEKRVAEVAEERRVLEIKKRHLESLVDFYGPTGIKIELVQKKIEEFAASINRHMAAFGFTIEIIVEPWQILAKGRPVTRLSRSERFRAGVAFQIALAKATGFNFVSVDNAEILVPAARQAMMKTLLESGLDQAIVFSTIMVAEDQFKPPKVTGLEVFMVRNSDGVSNVERLT